MLSDYILLKKASGCQLKTTSIISVLTEIGSIDQLTGERKKRVGPSHSLTGLAID